MIELCCEYLSVRCIRLYVSIMSRTRFRVKLKEKLNSKKDEDKLYGDLLATKLRSLSEINKLKAKHKIDNIMFTFQLQQDEESNLPPNHQRKINVQVNLSEALHQHLEPLPVYNLQHQSAELFCQISARSKSCSPKVISSIVIKILPI